MTYAETPIIYFSMGNFVRPIVMLVLKWDSLVVKEIEKLDNPNLGIEGNRILMNYLCMLLILI
jgi:hypothetical protein